jgi:hypothetical protein
MMVAEQCSCSLESYFAAEEEGSLMREDAKCRGIQLGVFPLALLIVLTAFAKVLYVHQGKKTLAFAKIVRMDVTFMEALQTAIFGTCAVFALWTYANRKPRAVHDGMTPENLSMTAFSILIVAGVILGSFTRRRTEDPEQRDRAGTSVAERTSRGGENIWEGGAKGVADRKRTVDRKQTMGEGEGGGGRGRGRARVQPRLHLNI